MTIVGKRAKVAIVSRPAIAPIAQNQRKNAVMRNIVSTERDTDFYAVYIQQRIAGSDKIKCSPESGYARPAHEVDFALVRHDCFE